MTNGPYHRGTGRLRSASCAAVSLRYGARPNGRFRVESQGILQSAGDVYGLWQNIPSASSPHPDMIDSVRRFYRVIVR